jgi:hypothetical protein
MSLRCPEGERWFLDIGTLRHQRMTQSLAPDLCYPRDADVRTDTVFEGATLAFAPTSPAGDRFMPRMHVRKPIASGRRTSRRGANGLSHYVQFTSIRVAPRAGAPRSHHPRCL